MKPKDLTNKILISIIPLMLVVFLYDTSCSQSEVHVKISTAGIEPMDMAVIDFTPKNDKAVSQEKDLSKNITAVVRQDLLYALVFNLVEADSFASSILKGNWYDFAGWFNLGAKTLVGGTVEAKKGTVIAEVDLWDVYRKRKISSEAYKTSVESYRALAHTISDDIVYKLTGEKGIFNSRIAFISDRTGYKEIYVCDYDGENQTQLTNHKSINLSPRWSPDGKTIAYTSYKGGNPDLWLLSLKDNKSKVISAQAGLNSAPAWSPDGRTLAMTLSKDGDAEIYLVNADGVIIRRLTKSSSIDSSPTWSPNGKEVAFSSDRAGQPQVYIMSAEGGDVRRLTYEDNYNDSPAWSPRGDKIAYVTRLEGEFQICTIDITGENLIRLTSQGSSENPHWSPDGLHIVFSSNRSGKHQIYTMNWDGSEQKPITGQGNNYNPDWSTGF